MPVRRGFLLVFLMLAVAFLGGCFLFSDQAPEASFVVTYDVDLSDRLVVELDASTSTDPGGDAIAAYMWTFGDDVDILTPLAYTKLVQTPVLRIRYPVEGTYAVTLVVRDDHGNSSLPVSKTVTIPSSSVAPTD